MHPPIRVSSMWGVVTQDGNADGSPYRNQYLPTQGEYQGMTTTHNSLGLCTLLL